MTRTAVDQLGHWIQGAWQKTNPSRSFESLDPTDGSVVAKFAIGTSADVDQAVGCAQEAFQIHRGLGPSIREQWLMGASMEIKRREDELVERLIDETGSTITKALREVATSANVLRAAAGACRRLGGEVMPTDVPGCLSLAIREPLGVIAGITPFNVPLIKAVKHSALAIATGNTVVMLPSDLAPSMAAMLADIYSAVGVPAGVFNVVFGRGDQIGDALTGHPDVAMIGFTGSTKVGRHVAGIASASGKRVTLEMGGKNAAVVLGDASLDQSVPAITMGAFLFQGQICMATSRVFATSTVLEELTERLIQQASRLKEGSLRDPDVVLGPMIRPAHQDRVAAIVQDAVDKGAQVLCGGQPIGNGWQPTILANTTDEMRIEREETFGPVLTVHVVNDLKEAIERVNATKFGLVASVFTHSTTAANRFVQECTAGMVHVNGSTIHEEAHVPFGGNGDSGFGREGAIVGVDELTRWKWATIR